MFFKKQKRIEEMEKTIKELESKLVRKELEICCLKKALEEITEEQEEGICSCGSNVDTALYIDYYHADEIA